MPSEMLTLNDYIAVIRRRKWVILSALFICALLGFVYAAHKGTTHKATVQVSATDVQAPSSSGGSSGSPSAADDARFLANQAAFARSAPVLDAAVKLAAKQHVVITLTKLSKSSSVTPSAVADILDFSVTNTNPSNAKILADSYANAYVSERQAQINAQYLPLLKQINANVKQLEHAMSSPDTPPEVVRAKRPQLLQALKLQTPLKTFLGQAIAGTSVQETTQVVATVKSSPVTFAFIGGLVGFVIGLIAAFIWDAIDSGKRTGREVAGTLQLPVLANIPTPPRAVSSEHRLVMMEPAEPSAESFRLLAVRLGLLCETSGRRTLLVTSALDSEGKSTTAANVAVALAQIGKSVVLVDGDLIRPTAARFFGAGDDPGLFEVLSGELDIDEVGTEVDLAGGSTGSLRVLPAGRVQGDATGLLMSDGMTSVLGVMKHWADYVIIDSPPLLTVSHAMALSSMADAVVVVARADRMTPEVTWNLQQTLDALPAPTLGVVVTAADAVPGYGYGYYGGTTSQPSPAPRRANGAARQFDDVTASSKDPR